MARPVTATPAQKRRTLGRHTEPELGFVDANLRRLVDNLQDVVFRCRPRPPGFEFVGRPITKLTGYRPSELYDDPLSALRIVHPDDRPILRELFVRGASLKPITVRWLRKDGAPVWVELRTTTRRDRDGTAVAIDGVAREIADPTLGSGANLRVHGDIRLDVERARAFVGGVEAHLTPSEFRLLVLLASHPGRVVARSSIMEALGNSRHIGSERTCEVHISKLRAKIEPDPHQPARIETVRGRGYRFIPSG